MGKRAAGGFAPVVKREKREPADGNVGARAWVDRMMAAAENLVFVLRINLLSNH